MQEFRVRTYELGVKEQNKLYIKTLIEESGRAFHEKERSVDNFLKIPKIKGKESGG